MSWDADLVTECCGTVIAEFNHTYNTTPIVRKAAQVIGVEFIGFQRTLNGMTGADGRDLLRLLADQIHDHPERYEPMNPSNGWGSTTSISKVMREMADAVPGHTATRWRVT